MNRNTAALRAKLVDSDPDELPLGKFLERKAIMASDRFATSGDYSSGQEVTTTEEMQVVIWEFNESETLHQQSIDANGDPYVKTFDGRWRPITWNDWYWDEKSLHTRSVVAAWLDSLAPIKI